MQLVERSKCVELHMIGNVTLRLCIAGCDINAAGELYFDQASGSCVQSCPIGFQGVFATGTCEPCEFSII